MWHGAVQSVQPVDDKSFLVVSENMSNGRVTLELLQLQYYCHFVHVWHWPVCAVNVSREQAFSGYQPLCSEVFMGCLIVIACHDLVHAWWCSKLFRGQ
jgi:hypothetical protein